VSIFFFLGNKQKSEMGSSSTKDQITYEETNDTATIKGLQFFPDVTLHRDSILRDTLELHEKFRHVIKYKDEYEHYHKVCDESLVLLKFLEDKQAQWRQEFDSQKKVRFNKSFESGDYEQCPKHLLIEKLKELDTRKSSTTVSSE
jgi:hypothetical protein